MTPEAHDRARDQLTKLMQALEQLLPDTNIILLVQPRNNNPGHQVNYIANCEREGARRALQHLLDRWDGATTRAH